MSQDAFSAALRVHMRRWAVISDGWGGRSIAHHMDKTGCAGWVIPDGAQAVPDYTYDFAGTDCDSQSHEVIKLNCAVSCACGQYADKRVEIYGTFSELLTRLLAIPVPRTVTF